MLALFGALGGYGPMLLDFAGLQYVTAGLERVILFLYPAIVIFFSAILFKKHIGKREWVALVITYIGVALAVGHDLSLTKSGSADTLLGAGLVFASQCFMRLIWFIAAGQYHASGQPLLPHIRCSLQRWRAECIMQVHHIIFLFGIYQCRFTG